MNNHIDNNIIIKAEEDLSAKSSEMMYSDIFGLNNCKTNWNEIISKRLILNVLECDKYSKYLNRNKADCLQGKLSSNLIKNCCK